MKKKKKAAPLKPHNLWKCVDCQVELEPEQLVAHLLVAHGVIEPVGERKMIMHIDSRESYLSLYNWRIGGVALTQSLLGVRRRDADLAVSNILSY